MRPRSIRKRFGQHFLEPAWVGKVLTTINPKPGDLFLEVGPGTGAVTIPLAHHVEALTAVEVDRDLSRALQDRLPANVKLVVGDVLAIDLPALLKNSYGRPCRIFGNLPYSVSSPVLFRFLAHRDLFIDATVMLQREVANRLLARAGDSERGVLSVLVSLYAETEKLLTLPPGAFRPMPQVHSTLVRLSFGTPSVPVSDPQLFETVVRRAFAHRRKTLENALAGLAAEHGLAMRSLLQQVEISPTRRPQTLELVEWVRLANLLSTHRQRARLEV
ncbi:MAG: 16S rRNA (adenine(1518)-N(6)/adenine(1519)-N(6))-dimethyltransferase RsmA [Acidimicrobiia bacterium]